MRKVQLFYNYSIYYNSVSTEISGGVDAVVFAFNIGGHKVIEKKYGMSWDVEGGKWGYVDTNGKEVIPANMTM